MITEDNIQEIMNKEFNCSIDFYGIKCTKTAQYYLISIKDNSKQFFNEENFKLSLPNISGNKRPDVEWLLNTEYIGFKNKKEVMFCYGLDSHLHKSHIIAQNILTSEENLKKVFRKNVFKLNDYVD